MFILYNLVIFPIVQFIELCYLFVFRVFKDPGTAILGVSIAVSVCTLPLYFFAEQFQQKERDIQRRLQPKIKRIKSVFRGDEQYMILAAYYRQNHYHPVYALRNIFGLLIQIPFFIAAYTYLSHLELLQGKPFLIINDLGKPDALLSAYGINVLPIIMTLVNVLSGTIYTRGLGIKDKIQLYGMSLVFLVLLYNSPSGLVLYWTMNNIFSLAKNMLQRTKHPKKIVYSIVAACIVLFDIFVIFFHHGYWLKRLVVAAAASSVLFLPLLAKQKQRLFPMPGNRDTLLRQNLIFILASVVLFLLAGFVIPSSLIASSVLEFSYIEPYSSPLPFIMYTVLQAAGVFLVWPFCIYFLFSQRIKKVLTICSVILVIITLVNTFLFPENFGFLTNTLIFSDPKPIFLHYVNIAWNIIAITSGIALAFILFYTKLKIILVPFNIIVIAALASFSIVNTVTITREYFRLQEQREPLSGAAEGITPVYTLSKTGKNVLFIMIDRTVSGYLPAIFKEKPELRSIFSGFTWYPNCVSFANHTFVGSPPLYGGYEYTPLAINERYTETILEKHKEAYLLLPLLFSRAGYSVTVTDPPFDNYKQSNLHIYSDYPQINAQNITRIHSAYWNRHNPGINGLFISDLLQNKLLRFSIFKMSPLILKSFVYDDGEWLTTDNINSQAKTSGGLTFDTIDAYALLDLLPELTATQQEQTNTFTMLYGQLPHFPAFLQYPDYKPAQTVTDTGNGEFSDEALYHVHMATFLLIGKWFSFLKEHGVYDNTKIIMAADHGVSNAMQNTPENINIPYNDDNRDTYSINRLNSYNPLLMVKDFDAEGEIFIDNTFMTNADAPGLTLENIIDNPVNPFTNKPLQSEKEHGIYITTNGNWRSRDHSKYQYRIRDDQWLYVKDNIFDPANWRSKAP